MRLLNLACGNVRPQSEEWTNLDNLHEPLMPGTPERNNLDQEKNYVNFDFGSGLLPFPDEAFDGILASHCIEHFSLLDSVEIIKDCHRILKPSGVMVVSVPDASIFRHKHIEDIPENAERIFGERIHPGEGDTFMQYAGFNRWHKQLLSEDSLWCLMRQSGFRWDEQAHYILTWTEQLRKGFTSFNKITQELFLLLNRKPFSLVMEGVKSP